MNEKQIKIDCDVINADGGTRTAAITGAWVALYVACEHLIKKGDIEKGLFEYQYSDKVVKPEKE